MFGYKFVKKESVNFNESRIVEMEKEISKIKEMYNFELEKNKKLTVEVTSLKNTIDNLKKELESKNTTDSVQTVVKAEVKKPRVRRKVTKTDTKKTTKKVKVDE